MQSLVAVLDTISQWIIPLVILIIIVWAYLRRCRCMSRSSPVPKKDSMSPS